MRVLWLCNVIFPQIAEKLNILGSNGGGWLYNQADLLDRCEDIDLAVCAPIKGDKDIIRVEWGNKSCFYGFGKTILNPCIYEGEVEEKLKKILEEFTPDIVHVFGTEFPHSLAITKVFDKERLVVQIQGLVSVCSRHYCTGIPAQVQKRKTFRDFIKNESIIDRGKQFEERGKFEIETIKNVNNIIGRSDWDFACTRQINPNAKYHFCNEILREDFYSSDKWSVGACKRHTLFISQAYYPIKGLHYALEGLRIIKDRYPEVMLKIAGTQIFNRGIRSNSYERYVEHLVREYGLSGNITVLGELNESRMRQEFLSAGVFISASTIENESNSLSEARILGVPAVSSYVGGTTGRITHGTDGYVYPMDEPYMMAYYVEKYFEMTDDEIMKISENEIKSQTVINDKEVNLRKLLEIYREVCGNLG